MNDEQRIIALLERSGWERTAQSIQLGTASLFHEGPGIRLEVEQELGKRELILTMAESSGTELTLFIDFDDRLDDLLHSLVASQDDITPENFRDHTRAWLAVCPSIYVQADEDSEPSLLSPE